jgi:hypothetical protein
MMKEAGVLETVDEGNPSSVKMIANTVNQLALGILTGEYENWR